MVNVQMGQVLGFFNNKICQLQGLPLSPSCCNDSPPAPVVRRVALAARTAAVARRAGAGGRTGGAGGRLHSLLGGTRTRAGTGRPHPPSNHPPSNHPPSRSLSSPSFENGSLSQTLSRFWSSSPTVPILNLPL